MGWFEDNALPEGVSREQADAFIADNPGDYGRLSSAFQSTDHRPYDSQTTDARELAANAAADAGHWTGSSPAGASYGAFMQPAGFGGMQSGSFGGVPAPFGEAYAPLARPSYLQGEYVPGQWGETFAAPEKPDVLRTPYALPTQAELEGSPGYLAGQNAMQRGMERSAAAKGTVLSGGFVGRALPRAMGEYAGGAYNNLVGQSLGARQQQYGEYSGDVSNAFQQYQQRYGQFADAEGLKLGARNTNETAFQGDQGTNLAGYKTRYGQYLDSAGMKRQAENDLWGREMDLSDLSLRAAALARP